MATPFLDSDIINNIEHTQPSSVILSQIWISNQNDTEVELRKMTNKMTVSINFEIWYFVALKRYESTGVNCRTWLHIHPETNGPPAMTLTE